MTKTLQDEDSKADLSREDTLDKIVNLDNIQDFETLNYLMLEALRFKAPARSGSNLIPQQDLKIGNLPVKKDEMCMVY